MIETDARTRSQVATFRNAGVGIQPTAYCWGCSLGKVQEGGAYLGRLRLFYCAACRPSKEDDLAAARAARAAARGGTTT